MKDQGYMKHDVALTRKVLCFNWNTKRTNFGKGEDKSISIN